MKERYSLDIKKSMQREIRWWYSMIGAGMGTALNVGTCWGAGQCVVFPFRDAMLGPQMVMACLASSMVIGQLDIRPCQRVNSK